ncbi:MAG: glycosyltransferase family 2 protein [Alphaproteobacteria bacterium]|nr:glycosyltransferase family 2 protein [Alphaproteobacteria bacterium]
MKKIAVITMLRNDEFFLELWAKYYSRELGAENCYALFDGTDQKIPAFAKKINTKKFERKEESRTKGDKTRVNRINDFANDLMKNHGYDIVIGTDVDEFIAVDPDLKMSLREYLSSVPQNRTALSPLGLDLAQHLTLEKPYDAKKTMLSQRKYAFISTRFTKSSIMLKPGRWGSGFHRMNGKNFKIDPNLYLFHMGSLDHKMSIDKINSDNRDASWKSHRMRRTMENFNLITNSTARDFAITKCARRIQQIARPPYSWNKPFMFGIKWVVKIPKRFEKLF